MTPLLPAPRGDLTEMLCARLKDSPRRIPSWATVDDDPLGSADVQLALHLCYGLHDDGFEGVDDGWEWEPSLLALRGNLERHFLAELPEHTARGLDGPAVVCDVRRLLGVGGPSLSDYMFQQGGIDELREFVIHRSINQRKEADPHTWAIPRLRGRAKSALVTLQTDEYGGGHIAVDDLIGGLGVTDHQALQDVPFGVAALMLVEGRFCDHLLTCWRRGATSLLPPERPCARLSA